MIRHDVNEGTEWLDIHVRTLREQLNNCFDGYATVELIKIVSGASTQNFTFNCEFQVNFISNTHYNKFKLLYPELLSGIRNNMFEFKDIRDRVKRDGEIVRVPTVNGYYIELFKGSM